MGIHEWAGQKVRPSDYPDLQALGKAYYEYIPNPEGAAEAVNFGTSGHRGKAGDGNFTAAHVAAVTQAVCTLRAGFGAGGPIFIGADTHYLSQLAYKTALSVLIANGIRVFVDSTGDFVPTPAVSRAIIQYNAERTAELADGIILTPSHNPPDCGGIKYNPVTGGPADGDITGKIEAEANRLLANRNKDVKCVGTVGTDSAYMDDYCTSYDYKEAYVEALTEVIDMEAISRADLHIMINALGGSGMNYWHKIAEKYDIAMDFINDSYDPQFSFMTYDHDGKVRMDCSSPYVMAGVMKNGSAYDLILANDPDYDRFGIVCGADGMISANAYLTVAAHYLATHRNFSGKGIGKTAVTTELLEKVADMLAVSCYEVPVGFKYFVELLRTGKIYFAGEESAGASFLTKDGRPWTTDKDGIILCLLAAEIMAVTSKSPFAYYKKLCESIGPSFPMRRDTPVSGEEKARIKALAAADIKTKILCGAPILSVRTTATYGDMPIGGVKIRTKDGWIAARPSGTEDMYKLYAESFVSAAHGDKLLAEGGGIIQTVLAKGG